MTIRGWEGDGAEKGKWIILLDTLGHEGRWGKGAGGTLGEGKKGKTGAERRRERRRPAEKGAGEERTPLRDKELQQGMKIICSISIFFLNFAVTNKCNY